MARITQGSRVLLLGAGGHARSLLGVLNDIGCEVVGLVADSSESPTVGEYLILGSFSDLSILFQEHGQPKLVLAIGDNFQRTRVYSEILLSIPKAEFTPVIHPSAIIAHDAIIGDGSIIMPGVVVMAGCSIGAVCVLNTRASLDHESTLADGASLAPGAVTGGRVAIGSRAFIGLGACLMQGVTVGADTVVGAGSLVLSDLPDSVLAHGQPARVIRSRAPEERFL